MDGFQRFVAAEFGKVPIVASAMETRDLRQIPMETSGSWQIAMELAKRGSGDGARRLRQIVISSFDMGGC